MLGNFPGVTPDAERLVAPRTECVWFWVSVLALGMRIRLGYLGLCERTDSWGLGFRVEGQEFCRVSCRAWGSGFRILGL